ncbi:MAG TPA: decaprenyl-phosphate phosphoribosyltransferase [Solirubrobacterales bacterium]|nr:decaprenyl-phosphate phosphoribosyltransferase [Solirubrobacterales bacterium]
METLTEERPPAPGVAGSPPSAAAGSKPLALLVAMRPQEWIKNLLVFAGLLFSGKLDEGAQVLDATLAFSAFCAISSAGYLFNDLRDAAHDRLHPEKRLRPIASGELPVGVARTCAAALAVVGVALALIGVSTEVAGMVALYGAITAAYSLILKQLVILDVMTIASLFLLRVLAGAVAVEASASEWLLLCTAMLALFLGFTKRRQEAMMEQSSSAASSSGTAAVPSSPATRPVLEHYSLGFLDQMVAMVTAAAIMSYAIYAVNSPLIGSRMLATAPSVLYGIFRYLYLIYDRGDTRSTSAILTKDPGMIFAAVTWIGAALAMLYIFD